MAAQKKSAATIKFFNSTSSFSESDDSNEDDKVHPDSNLASNADSAANPFEDIAASDCSDVEGRDGEESIYDVYPSEINFSSRTRTDSDSNYLQNEEVGLQDEPLIVNMLDDHFGLPGDLSRLRDVKQEIDKLKELIYTKSEDSPERGQLIEKLIGLRLRKTELENPANVTNNGNSKTIYGHEFRLKESSAETERYCEVCLTVVWGVIHTWYSCISCHICCHEKCLNSLKRMCASKKISESSTHLMTICKERGMAAQNYKCFECQTPISYKSGGVEPRQCDYTGNYYCPTCHWNDETVIPARILHNWDFIPRRVCRASKQYLRLMYHRPVLAVEQHNKYLLNYVEELSEVKKLRSEILLMKSYFLSCQLAMQSKLLLLLEGRQHFVDNADYYSVHDLVELVNEKLLPNIVNVHASFAAHIKVDCASCRGKGYYCEICQKPEIIFPFDNICMLCKECSNVYHKHCFTKAAFGCPKCERKMKRLKENERKAEILRQIEQATIS